jgi:hypothetical protein
MYPARNSCAAKDGNAARNEGRRGWGGEVGRRRVCVYVRACERGGPIYPYNVCVEGQAPLGGQYYLSI